MKKDIKCSPNSREYPIRIDHGMSEMQRERLCENGNRRGSGQESPWYPTEENPQFLSPQNPGRGHHELASFGVYKCCVGCLIEWLVGFQRWVSIMRKRIVSSVLVQKHICNYQDIIIKNRPSYKWQSLYRWPFGDQFSCFSWDRFPCDLRRRTFLIWCSD